MAPRLLHWLVKSNGIPVGLIVLAVIVSGKQALARDLQVFSTGSAMITQAKVTALAVNSSCKPSPTTIKGTFQVRASTPCSSSAQADRLFAQTQSEIEPSSPAEPPGVEPSDHVGEELSQPENLDLDPGVIQNSPVLQRWLQTVPDISDEIRNQPSFRTRLRVGYAQFPSSNQASGIHLSVEDLFLVAGTGLTASGTFNRSWNDDRESFGAEARYYLLPLGSYVNLAPTLGYRSLETPDYTTNGVDLGFRLMIIPSRGGGADISLSQHWVAPGSPQEVGMTSISVGYAVTPRLRLGTDVEFQNSTAGQDSRVGLLVEWLM